MARRPRTAIASGHGLGSELCAVSPFSHRMGPANRPWCRGHGPECDVDNLVASQRARRPASLLVLWTADSPTRSCPVPAPYLGPAASARRYLTPLTACESRRPDMHLCDMYCSKRLVVASNSPSTGQIHARCAAAALVAARRISDTSSATPTLLLFLLLPLAGCCCPPPPPADQPCTYVHTGSTHGTYRHLVRFLARAAHETSIYWPPPPAIELPSPTSCFPNLPHLLLSVPLLVCVLPGPSDIRLAFGGSICHLTLPRSAYTHGFSNQEEAAAGSSSIRQRTGMT